MSISALSYPRRERTGSATATVSVNSFQSLTTDKNQSGESAAFFLDPLTAKPAENSFSGKNEKLCRTFSPFGGSWDYSEVD